MDKLSFLLPSALRRRGLFAQVSASVIVMKAADWLKERIPSHATTLHVLSFADGILSIGADHSIAAQECVLQETALRAALESAFHGVVVREVRVQRT